MWCSHYLGKKALKLCFHPRAWNLGEGPRCPKKQPIKKLWLIVYYCSLICFTRESLMLTERAHK